jgi:hypothetical protein
MVLNDSVRAGGDLWPEARSNVSAIVAFVNRDKKSRSVSKATPTTAAMRAPIWCCRSGAEAVRALVGAGVDKRRITTFGMGQAQPVAPNTTEEGRAKNRRVDVILEDR